MRGREHTVIPAMCKPFLTDFANCTGTDIRRLPIQP